MNNPSILLADEPTGALDSVTGNEIMGLFERLWQQGNTIVLVTHELDIAMRAHRVIERTVSKGVSDQPDPGLVLSADRSEKSAVSNGLEDLAPHVFVQQ